MEDLRQLDALKVPCPICGAKVGEICGAKVGEFCDDPTIDGYREHGGVHVDRIIYFHEPVKGMKP